MAHFLKKDTGLFEHQVKKNKILSHSTKMRVVKGNDDDDDDDSVTRFCAGFTYIFSPTY